LLSRAWEERAAHHVQTGFSQSGYGLTQATPVGVEAFLLGSALVAGQVEFPAGDEDVGGAQIAVHDGHIGREIPVTWAVGAVEQIIGAGLVVVVTPD